MSIEVMTRVWKESKQTECSRLLLLLALADHADPDGVCWPGIPHLARKIRKTERHVRRLLRDLEKSGDVYTGRNMGRRDTNLYYVTVGFTQKEIEDTLVERFGLTRGSAIDKATKIVTTPDAGVIPDSHVAPDAYVPPTPDASVPTPLTPASLPPDMDVSLTIINHQDPSSESSSPIGEKSNPIVEEIIEQTLTHPGPEDLARKTLEKRAEAGGDWGSPSHAGGADALADDLIAIYCQRLGEALPRRSETRACRAAINKVLKAKGLRQDGRIAKRGMEVLLDPDGEYGWYHDKYTLSVGNKLFLQHYGKVLSRLIAGGDGYSKEHKKGTPHATHSKIAPHAAERTTYTAEEAAPLIAAIYGDDVPDL